ncbi:MAG: glycoside hydrolase family 172 protein, partial [Polyangiales bacterium]
RAIVTTDAGVAMEGSESVDLFYEVNYRQYPSGTTVETFSDEAYEAARDDVRATAERLTSSSPSGRESAALERASFMLDPGDPDSMFRIDAPASGAVVRELTIDSIADLDLEEQREIDVVVRFDGEETIRAPLPDLFGAGPKAAAYESLPVTIEPTGTMRLRWPMPFQTTMELQLQTDADLGMATISGELVWEPDEWGSESLHFHAGRRASRGFEARRHDRNLVEIRGRGTYVGNALTVINDSKCWWGEGDQRMWVDDEEFPSHLGTGTEDYYGYAWAQTDVFDRPYHAQPQYEAGQGTDDCGRGEDLGGTASMNRWHVIDAIPFDDAFRFDLEIWHWNPDARLALSSVHYWYARPGGTDNLPEEGPRDVVSVGDLR